MIRTLDRALHAGMDGTMCALMNFSQWRLRHHAVTKERLENYLRKCEAVVAAEYYATPEENRTLPAPDWHLNDNILSWNSPLPDEHPENHKARALFFQSDITSDRPTLFLLHALMSASDIGYRRIASRFTKRGWNVLFPTSRITTAGHPRLCQWRPDHHLGPRRKCGNPKKIGHRAAPTPRLDTGQWLPSDRTDGNQLRGMGRLAGHGVRAGRFRGASSAGCRCPPRHLRQPGEHHDVRITEKNGVHPEDLSRHAHLSSPAARRPLTPPDRITVIGGTHDRLSPPESLRALCERWGGARYLEVNQGHFGYRAMRCALAEAECYQ